MHIVFYKHAARNRLKQALGTDFLYFQPPEPCALRKEPVGVVQVRASCTQPDCQTASYTECIFEWASYGYLSITCTSCGCRILAWLARNPYSRLTNNGGVV